MMPRALELKHADGEIWCRVGAVTKDGADFPSGVSLYTPDEITARDAAIRAAAIEECARVADRLSAPNDKKHGKLYYIHIGNIAAALAISTAIRSLAGKAG